MPNHVENDMYVEGKLKDVKEFNEWIKPFVNDEEKNISINLIPYPPEREIINRIKAKAEEIGTSRPDWLNSGGQEWCVQNWGSKWGIYSLEIEQEPNDFRSDFSDGLYKFVTAWSPSFPLYLKLAEKFPKLSIRITYFEKGMAFQGFYEFKDGKLGRHEESKYYGSRGG